MSIDFHEIYRAHADEYDRMVSAEDCDGNLLPALKRAARLDGARVVEVGVGTGRVTRMLLEAGVSHVIGIDTSEAMLSVARGRLEGSGLERTLLQTGDAAAIPAADASADVAIAGWTFGHTTQWAAGTWRARIGQFVDELERVTRPGGAQLILETLGTGALSPAPPNEALAAYYEFLEAERGYQREAIATDYLFASPEEAAKACGFFFGAQFAETILREGWSRVPEWTGLWSRTRDLTG
ncbi:MAG: class I SAM-dependent methyltransferase [Deltaproteobacteria bacterium]|nr:class I SAM-dependent methyltransferase [Deltaproteobacteria bacterium]